MDLMYKLNFNILRKYYIIIIFLLQVRQYKKDMDDSKKKLNKSE